MLSDIIGGNAAHDGVKHRQWFVGNLEDWCKDESIPFTQGEFKLRQCKDLEIKWGVHRCSEGKDT